MSKIAFSSFAPRRRFRLSANQMKVIANAGPSCPALLEPSAMLAVERILNAWAEDHARHLTRPDYQAVKKSLQSIRDPLGKTVVALRRLSLAGQPVNDFLYPALETEFWGPRAGQQISLDSCLAILLSLQSAADGLAANLKDVYGQSGGDGPPAAIALDQWIERMFCLFERLGGDTKLPWRHVEADNSTDDDAADVDSSGERGGEIVDLLRAIINVVAENEDQFPAGIISEPARFGRAFGQRVYRVVAPWQLGTPVQREVRLNEIDLCLMSNEDLAARRLADRRARHAQKLEAARAKLESSRQFSTVPPAPRSPGGVTYLDEGRPSPPIASHAAREERADAKTDKPRRRRRPSRPSRSTRAKPAR